MIGIAISPISECVSFPRAVFPLHVFETHYRNMVHYCLDNELLLGIIHTQKMLSEAKSSDSLAANINTYKPFTIFSAGACKLLKVEDNSSIL